MEEGCRNAGRIDRRTAAFIALIIIIPASVVGTSYTLTYLEVCLSTPPVSFTLVMTNQGFNGSITHTDQWPVFNIGRCDRVTVHLVNEDTTAHGFAITHYFDGGVRIQPGTSYDVTFNANRSGSFLVYCNIICPIHQFMQNGRLNVR